MKNILKFSFVFLLILGACKQEKKEVKTEKSIKITENYASFGDKISEEKAMTSEEMLAKFSSLKTGDTINVKFASSIKEVCSKKGCWMKLPLNKDTETMVRFKDYGFFMPLDADGKEVIVAGKAFVKETSVKELQHYAEDAGKSKEEIAKITEPKTEFAFEANGVLLKTK
ncbi:MAG: DUF4920 domain-containing protein [Polaribacter sp.]|uniref:DUF4920 domain-containing protein n=1 Tax=Polaribacter sp. TaxID=1920175 RepID=UPI002F35D030